jgi:hypothetical protein
MSTLFGVVLCAVLFIIFGLVRPRTDCNGSGCGACGGACHRKETAGEEQR